MIRNSLAAGAVALASVLAPVAAFAFEAPTAAAFFGRFNVPEDISIEVQDDGSVVISAPEDRRGWVAFTLREHEVPSPGHRSVSIDVTIVADGGGWPDRLVGFGMVQGYQDQNTEAPFSLGVVSPQDGGSLLIGNRTENGFSIPQTMGGSAITLGETVTLSMTESSNGLEFTVTSDGSSSGSSTNNNLIAAAMTGDNRVGFILGGGGTYVVSNLVVTESD